MTKQSVLLIDDEATGRELLARGLVRAGFDVVAVSDGNEAVPLLARPWTFVVTDLVMPGLDGLGVLAELNRLEHHALRVVITSFADKERLVAVLNLGSDYLLEKPFSVERLKAILDDLWQKRGDDPQRMAQFFRRRLLGLPLTARERELVELVLHGDSNKQIALRLGLSEQTVKNALSAAYGRLGVQSRGELFHVVFPL